jgi:hypothetical protein
MKSRCVLAIASATFVLLIASAAPASWCAIYQTGGTNCGFSSFQSCQSAVRGVGGSCTQAGTANESPRRKRWRPSRSS